MKKIGVHSCAKGAKIRSKIRFFVIFLKFGPLVSLEITLDDSLEHCLTISRGKTHEKNFRGPKLVPKLGFLLFSQGCIITFP